MDILKELIIIFVILVYWKFVYYKYHKKDFTPVSFFVIGGSLFFYGLYRYLFDNSVFQQITGIYFIMSVFLIAGFTLVTIGIRKKGLNKNIDITLSWTRRVFPKVPFYFWMIIAFPAMFFIMIATYSLLGQEHVFLWGMIFIAWLISDIRLLRYISKR